MIDTDIPDGAWRAALEPAARCAVCKQAICAHPDLLYIGLVPASPPSLPGDRGAALDPRAAPRDIQPTEHAA